jgi:hypothetical protein
MNTEARKRAEKPNVTQSFFKTTKNILDTRHTKIKVAPALLVIQ